MNTTYAIIMSEAELKALIAAEVRNATSAHARQLDVVRKLPVRLTCKAAAELLGVSISTFHAKHSNLKRFEGNRVFVKAGDLVGV